MGSRPGLGTRRSWSPVMSGKVGGGPWGRCARGGLCGQTTRRDGRGECQRRDQRPGPAPAAHVRSSVPPPHDRREPPNPWSGPAPGLAPGRQEWVRVWTRDWLPTCGTSIVDRTKNDRERDRMCPPIAVRRRMVLDWVPPLSRQGRSGSGGRALLGWTAFTGETISLTDRGCAA